MISVLWLLPKGEASAVRTCLGRSAFLFFVASSSDSTMSLRPVVFIGSSSEGRPVAEAIQTTLNGNEVEAVLWTTLFEPSYLTIEALDQKSDDFDFALFVFSSDDVLESRGTRGPAPRDNILLEFGLFVGRLGRERVFYAFRSGDRPKLPSDLAGTTGVEYTGSGAFGLEPAVAKLSQQLRKRMVELGPRSRVPEPPAIRLDFGYLGEVQPTERGWVVGHDNPGGPLPVIDVLYDQRFARCLVMDAPDGAYMDCKLLYAVRAREVEFLCGGDLGVFYAGINIWKPGHGKIELAYLRAAGWDNHFETFNDNEWFVSYGSKALDRGWRSVQMSIRLSLGGHSRRKVGNTRSFPLSACAGA